MEVEETEHGPGVYVYVWVRYGLEDFTWQLRGFPSSSVKKII